MASFDPRHAARKVAMQQLFNFDFREKFFKEEDLTDVPEALLCEVNKIKEFDEKLLEKILSGVSKHQKKIDKLIIDLAPERPIEEIGPIDLQILRIAIAEGFIQKFTPHKVAIDEAIELGKEFGSDTSSKFINGVLGTLLNKKEDYGL